VESIRDREFITGKVCHLKHASDERYLNLEIKRLEVRLDGNDKALVLGVSELERRLEALNQLRADVVRDRDLFVRKDKFENLEKDLSLLRADYGRGHLEVLTRITVIETRSLVWSGIIALLVIGIQIALHYWKGN
jgi:hypothetical protein